jgi:hypothetical protein
MRFLWFLCVFFALMSQSSVGSAEPNDAAEERLDTRALSKQMLHLHPNLNFDSYALGYLQHESPLQYNSVVHDKTALSTAVIDVSTKLATIRAARPALPELRLDLIGEASKLIGTSKSELSSVLTSGAIPIDNNEKVFPGFMPSSFLTLFPNASLASETAVTPEFAGYIETRLANQDRTPIFISAYFRPVRFQQDNVVQTYLTRVKFYADAERTKLLDERMEKRNGPALIAKTLLAEGLTLNASPDHSTVINGEYMLEFFPAAGWAANQCKLQNAVQGHRAWLCKRVLPKIEGQAFERADHLYVGGRLVQVAYVIVKPAPNTDVAAIKLNIADRYKGTFDATQMQYQWQNQLTHYQADFSMLKSGKKPYLQIRASEYQELLDGKPGYEPFL